MAARRSFGATWWGQAWLDALEARAVHDPNRLPRGRTYARHERASSLRIGRGQVRASVRGSDAEPYDVLLQVRTFRPDEWECVLDAIVAEAGHAAALLEGELHPGILASAAAMEVDLLPRSGELRTACSCPDWAEPCKHAAAVCYLVADAIDRDPFVVLHLRGLERDALLEAVRGRRAGTAGAGDDPARGEHAGPGAATRPDTIAVEEAFARPLGPLPVAPVPPRDGPGRPAPWPSDPPASAPFDPAGLHTLVADAAGRAWAIRAGLGSSALALDATADLARWAGPAPAPVRRVLARRAAMTEALLDALAAAYQVAGVDGIRVLEDGPWPAPMSEMARARQVMIDAGVAASQVQVRANQVTVVGAHQFRLGRDRRWYRFDKHAGRWVMTLGPAEDVEELVEPADAAAG